MDHLKFKEAPGPYSIIWENRKVKNGKDKCKLSLFISAKLVIWFAVCFLAVHYACKFIETAKFTVFRFNNYCD
jgi:hypothetical protein